MILIVMVSEFKDAYTLNLFKIVEAFNIWVIILLSLTNMMVYK